MARVVEEVLVGPGTLYTAPIGEAFPTDPGTTPAGNWLEIGYSEAGWTLGADKTFDDIFVEEEVDPIASYKTAQQITLAGELAQASLVSLQLAFGGGTIQTDVPGAGFDTYTPPASDSFDLLAVLFRSVAPDDTTWFRDWQFQRCIVAGAISADHGKAPRKTLIAMEFKVLKPSSGALFTVIDQTSV